MDSAERGSSMNSLLLWFPLPCKHAISLCAQPKLWPFFVFFAKHLCNVLWYNFRMRWKRVPTSPVATESTSNVCQQIFPPPNVLGDLAVSGSSCIYGSFRIPSLLRLGGPFENVVLAFAEGRGADKIDWGRIDLVMRQSFDGGTTWAPGYIVVVKGADIGSEDATVGNPCACWDTKRRRVVLLFTVTQAGASEPAVWCRSAPPRRAFITFSSDGGSTWQPPREITADVAHKGWTWYATGPGHAIQLREGFYKGRIVVPCDHVCTEVTCCGLWKSFKLHSHVIISDDGGDTWRVGGIGPTGTNECQLVELLGGELLLNMRDFSGRCCRRLAKSSDGGASFIDIGYDEYLVEPRPAGCQASLYSWCGKTLLFANPAHESGQRRELLLRYSLDLGRTWSSSKRIHLGPAAYSCIELFGIHTPNQIAILFECGSELGSDPYEAICLASIPFDPMLSSPDT